VCFRYAPPALRGNSEKLDSVNKLLLERIQLSGEAFLSSTVVRGAFVLRACIVNCLTQRSDLDFLLELVLREGRALAR